MVEEINMQKSNRALWITGAIIAILVVGLITNGFGLFNPRVTGGVVGTQKIPLSVASSPVLGNPDAPVTIYEFSDFSCPFCKTANDNAVREVIENYVNTGKAKLVFKYYPGHGTAIPAHTVSYALNDQNPQLFWQFVDLAFENQADVGDMGKMKALAQSIGADMGKLDKYIESKRANYLMDQDIEMGRSNGVQGTPSFIINGKMIVGAEPFSEFQKIIEAELNKN